MRIARRSPHDPPAEPESFRCLTPGVTQTPHIRIIYNFLKFSIVLKN